jgi:arsenate reductase (glutaredoxin)
MSVSVFGIRNCDTMKRAFAWLDAEGVDFRFVDYKKPGLAAEHLGEWIARAGWEALLNRRGLTWKKLTEAERAALDAHKARALMESYPSLIKRPVLVDGKTILVGFAPEAYARHFKRGA